MPERNVTPGKGFLRPGYIVAGIVVVAAIILLSTSFYVVNETEQAVVLTFGRYTATKGPGLNFKLPFGIQRNYNVPVKVYQSEQFGFRELKPGVQSTYDDSPKYNNESIMLTGDLNIVDVEWVIQYLIRDPYAWLFNTEERTKTIRDISQSVMNMLVGDRSILEVLGSARTAIESEAKVLMNESLKGYGLGIEITSVQLQNIVPPAGVTEAFQDVNKAQQDMNRLINEGKEAYNTAIPKAQGEADRIRQIALGYATERVNKARGDVARFLAVYEEYRKAPDVTRTRLYYEMMEEVFADASGVDLIDSELGNFLPLKTLGSQTGGR